MLIPVAAIAALLVAWFLAGKMHRFAYWIEPKSDADVAALATNGWTAAPLQVAAGVTLRGLLRPPRAPEAPWILFAPGNSEAMLAGFRSELDRVRGDLDVGMAFWAYRGFDASDGTPSPTALADDLRVQWRHLRAMGIPPERIEVWGYSLGSILAAQLAAGLSDSQELPRRLVLLATGEQIPVMRHGWFGRFLPDDLFELTTALPRIRCPVVIVHGTDDNALPILGARELAARLGARATLHELPGRGHFDLWLDAQRLLLTSR